MSEPTMPPGGECCTTCGTSEVVTSRCTDPWHAEQRALRSAQREERPITVYTVGEATLPRTCPGEGCGGKVHDWTVHADPHPVGVCCRCKAQVNAVPPEVRPARAARATYRFEAWVAGALPLACPLEPLCSGEVEASGYVGDEATQGTCRKCGTRVFVERRRTPDVRWVPRS